MLRTSVAGIDFPTPLGLAAGFDKDAKAAGRLLRLGFGFVEIGTVTPRPQPGNETPRLFRLEEDEAVINRFGFNSDGHDIVERRLARRKGKPGLVGVNLGANKESADRIADYESGVRRFGRHADYLTINISSPNTPGLRDLQSSDHLPELIERVLSVREAVRGPPVFLKVSPDLDDQQIIQVSRTALRVGVDGLIVGNTTVTRPQGLHSPKAEQPGGLSGKPLKPIALRALKAFRSEVGSHIPLIGVGGIGSAEDAYERIRAGASLIQLYTALAYEGPGLVSSINDGLVALLKRDGFSSVQDAVGTDEIVESHHEAA
jgi:dihydroorotate dehydrogenase